MNVSQVLQRTRRGGSVLQLIRPLNCLLVVAGVVLGGVLTAGEAFAEGAFLRLIWAAASAVGIGGAANSINDVFDLEIDRINRPDRPLPAGRVTVRTAWIVWGVGSLAGIGMSWLLSWTHVAMAVGAVALLFLYSVRFKRMLLVGNVVVAAMVALTLVYGGAAVGPLMPAFIGAAFAFLTNVAREIIKDVQDARGDASEQAKTLPLAYGAPAALRSAIGLILLTIALTPVPYVVWDYSGLFLLLVLVADLVMVGVVVRLAPGTKEPLVGQASTLMKWSMGCGIAALAAAGLMG